MAAKRTSKTAEPPKPINTYGYPLRDGVSQLFYDAHAFAKNTPIERGIPIRPRLFKRIAEGYLPGHFEWHRWTDKVVSTMSDLQPIEGSNKSYQLVGAAGGAGTAKTFNFVSFACVWWLCDPFSSSIILISTSKDSLKKRGWSEVLKCYSELSAHMPFGNLVSSRMIWQAKKGDDKHAIFGKAVEEGPVQKVADDIKGIHTRRQMVIIDEATSVPPAIYEACANLAGYPDEFILVLLGNPLNRLDQFGRFCEPEDGWTSVTVETSEWNGKPQAALFGRKPKIIRFDAEKSPNITAGQIISKHLPTKADVESAQKLSGGQTPHYWQNFRGFWPPEGLTKTVFSEASLRQNDAAGKQQFTGRWFNIIGFFDPAFGGGDRPALRFAKLGELVGGKWGIEAMPPIVLPISAISTNPVHFQLAEQLRRQCESFTVNGVKYECPPENLGIDATGEGGGLCDIVARTWSPRIIRVEFGGRASEDACSLEDVRPACEVYENKSVEMWFRSRDAVNSRQLKGIDPETAIELCNRTFDDYSKKIKLQKKKDYKILFGKSCDFADCLVGLSEVARIRGFKLAPTGETIKAADVWNATVKATHEVFNDADSYQPEEMMELEEAE